MSPATCQKRKSEEAFSKLFIETMEKYMLITSSIDENPDYCNRNRNMMLTYEHIKNCRVYWDKVVNPKLEKDIVEDTHKLFKKTEYQKNFKKFCENLKIMLYSRYLLRI